MEQWTVWLSCHVWVQLSDKQQAHQPNVYQDALRTGTGYEVKSLRLPTLESALLSTWHDYTAYLRSFKCFIGKGDLSERKRAHTAPEIWPFLFMLSISSAGGHHSITSTDQKRTLLPMVKTDTCVLFLTVPVSGNVQKYGVYWACCALCKIHLTGQVRGFPAQGRLPVTIIHTTSPHKNPTPHSHKKPENCSGLKMCPLVSMRWTAEPTVKDTSVIISGKQRGEDCASVSAASLAHISGPAGLKTPESHWRAEQKKPTVVLQGAVNYSLWKGHSVENNHLRATARQQHWCFLK